MVDAGEYADRILDAHFNSDTPHKTFREVLNEYDESGIGLPSPLHHGAHRRNVEYVQAASEEIAAENDDNAPVYASIDQDATELLEERERTGRLSSPIADLGAGVGVMVGSDFTPLDETMSDLAARYAPEVAGAADFTDWALVAGFTAMYGAKHARKWRSGRLDQSDDSPAYTDAKKLLHFRLHDHYDE